MTPGEQRRRWDRRYIQMARHISTWSLDPSTQCGAVIVDPKRRVISTGYNGFPRGMPDDPALYEDRDEKYPRIVHADMNALLFAKRDLDGCTIYTWPFLPCARCFVHLAQAGIDRYVAPPPVEQRHIERWGPEIAKTKQYASEMGLVVVELEPDKSRAVRVDGPTPAVPHGTIFCRHCLRGLWYTKEHSNLLFCTNKECPEFLLDQEGVQHP